VSLTGDETVATIILNNINFPTSQSEHKVKINNPTASQHKIKKLPDSNFFFDTGD
jgi:hypothetical protein